MARDDLNALASFLAVAEERSFTAAARRLGVSPSALSHAVRALEERVGVRLLARTTRSVAPTDAGALLLARLGPAISEIDSAVASMDRLRTTPAGLVRIVVSPFAARAVVAPKMAQLARTYPDIVLDVTTTDEQRVDLVTAGFDAGIHLGEFIAKDMVAVRVSPDQVAAIVAAPSYLATRPAPKTPQDLTAHHCINFRQGSLGLYRWEFSKGKRTMRVAVDGPLVVGDAGLAIRAAVDGVGITYAFESQVSDLLASGALVRVLKDWCQPFDGYFMYYPSRQHQSPALAAVVEVFRRP